MSREEQTEYFKQSLDFIKERHSEKNTSDKKVGKVVCEILLLNKNCVTRWDSLLIQQRYQAV